MALVALVHDHVARLVGLDGRRFQEAGSRFSGIAAHSMIGRGGAGKEIWNEERGINTWLLDSCYNFHGGSCRNAHCNVVTTTTCFILKTTSVTYTVSSYKRINR